VPALRQAGSRLEQLRGRPTGETASTGISRGDPAEARVKAIVDVLNMYLGESENHAVYANEGGICDELMECIRRR
jgi:hypothetical protein